MQVQGIWTFIIGRGFVQWSVVPGVEGEEAIVGTVVGNSVWLFDGIKAAYDGLGYICPFVTDDDLLAMDEAE